MRTLQCSGDDREGRYQDALAFNQRSPSERDQIIAEARAGAFLTDPKGRKFDPLGGWLRAQERRTPPRVGVVEGMARKLDGMRAEDVNAFAGGLVERLRQPARDAAPISEDSTAKLSYPAQNVVVELSEQCIVPLAELGAARPPFNRDALDRRFTWVIREALVLRRWVFVTIDKLLGDKTPLPQTAPAAPRVCDAGYSLMRKALDFGSELADPFASEAAFYALAEPERDAMILAGPDDAGLGAASLSA